MKKITSVAITGTHKGIRQIICAIKVETECGEKFETQAIVRDNYSKVLFHKATAEEMHLAGIDRLEVTRVVKEAFSVLRMVK